MKKIIYLSTMLVFLFAVSGCNLFENIDKQSDSDAEVFYYNAHSIINSGDKVELAKLENLILERIADKPEESAALKLMLSDVRLALSGVDLLDTATKLFDMVNAADNPEDIATNITSIISMNPEELDKLKLSLVGYSELNKTPEIGTLSTEERNTYMTAGIANAMYSANVILNVFDTDGNGTVDDSDKFVDFDINSWNSSKDEIVDSLSDAAVFLNVALNNSAESTADNAKLVNTISDIKTELNNYSTIDAADFDYIKNTILTGKSN